jgi:hypothetical protein
MTREYFSCRGEWSLFTANIFINESVQASTDKQPMQILEEEAAFPGVQKRKSRLYYNYQVLKIAGKLIQSENGR